AADARLLPPRWSLREVDRQGQQRGRPTAQEVSGTRLCRGRTGRDLLASQLRRLGASPLLRKTSARQEEGADGRGPGLAPTGLLGRRQRLYRRAGQVVGQGNQGVGLLCGWFGQGR